MGHRDRGRSDLSEGQVDDVAPVAAVGGEIPERGFESVAVHAVDGGPFRDGPPGAVEKLALVRGVTFRWKSPSKPRNEQVGVVAQEVRQVIPEAVTENSKGYLLVNNDPIIWSMLNAIKEQQRQFEQQQAVLRTQAAAIRNLKSELRATRQSLQKVKAQVAASQPTMVATK